MLNRIHPRLSPATVISVIALFVALCAGAYAVAIAPKNSVVSRSIKNNAVKSVDVKDGSLTGNDLALNDVSSALQIRTGTAKIVCTTSCGSPTTLFTEGTWVLTGSCVNDGAGTFHAKIDLSHGADAIVAVNDGAGLRTSNSTTIAQTGTVTNQTAATASQGGEFSALLASGASNSHISGHVLAVADGGADDNNSVGFCKFAFEGLGQ